MDTTSLKLLCISSLLVAACGEPDCPRRLETSTVYTGKQSGVFYSREILPGGVFGGGGSAPTEADAGASQGGGTSSSCWDETAAQDEPGGLLEAWIDLDSDDGDRCGGVGRTGLADRKACAPEAGDPYGSKAFTLRASGTTRVELVFGDAEK